MDAELKEGIVLIHKGLLLLADQGVVANLHRERANELLAEQNQLLAKLARPTISNSFVGVGQG